MMQFWLLASINPIAGRTDRNLGYLKHIHRDARRVARETAGTECKSV